MAGLYIHIPFCRKACHYCNFHFSTSLARIGDLVTAIHREIDMTPETDRWPVETIYLGGGTPSLLDAGQMGGLLSHVRKAFPVSSDAEVTLEANPDDLDAGKVQEWRSMGVNRLSIGIQSFRDADLLWMNRAHNAEQALRCIEKAQAGGIHNMTIDLIYGIPGLDDTAWSDNIETALSMDVPHLSAYALTVEPRTALDKMVRSGAALQPSDERQVAQYLMLSDRMAKAGFEHYEVSNFARPGMHSRHNRSYWQGIPYLGFGPSAHSYDGTCRKWNVADNSVYLRSIMEGRPAFESETLDTAQRLNEYVMVSLRTADGIDMTRVRSCWGELEEERIRAGMEEYVGKGLAERNGDVYRLNPRGWLFADGISSSLFLV